MVFAGGLLFAAASAATGFYYYARFQDVPPPGRMQQAQAARPVAKFIAAPQDSSDSKGEGASQSPASPTPSQPSYQIGLDPMKEFHEELNRVLVGELGTTFPELHTVLGVQQAGGDDSAHRRVAFQLLEAADKAPADQRPVMFLAADLVAQQIWCAFEDKTGCEKLRGNFAQHQLTLKGAGLGGVFVYGHDLLWRLWQDYPSTEWGERAFVLLLEHGWDTGPTCEKGAEQFREVIRQGEAFLHERSNSSNTSVVTFLVAEAYATRWSLSATREGGDMSDYVDPAKYKDGAEEARVKAVGYFEQLQQGAPQTQFGEYARQILPPLRDRQSFDHYRFFCIYD
jgi:hypothetical protein